MEALITASQADDLLQHNHAATLLAPGQRFAIEDAPAAGDGVEASGDDYMATRLGYPYQEGGVVAIGSPILVSADGHTATLVLLPPVEGRLPLQSSWIHDALSVAGVVHGVHGDIVDGLCEDTPDSGAVVLAKATPPQPGTDARVEYRVDLEKRAGRLLADGSIDLRERNSVVSVAADDEVARLVAATPGQDGIDVRGEVLPTTQAAEVELHPGDNVTVVESDDAVRLLATIDGHIALDGDTVHVRDVFTVEGDVDYDVGNLDVTGDLDVRGLVGSGFTLKAGGSIAVSGIVENGAILQAGGDVVVAQGILGEKTRVRAGESVTTKFIQGSTVVAAVDVTVGSYIFNGRVRSASGTIRVENLGGERSGSIVGGQVLAGQRLEAHRLGASDGDRTIAGIGMPPEITRQLRDMRQEHQTLTGQAARLQSVLGVSSVSDREQLARLLARTAADQLDRVEQQLKQLREWRQRLDELQQQIDTLEEEAVERLRQGRVYVHRAVLADVQIEFGAAKRQLSEPIRGACELYMADGKVQWRAAGTDDKS